MQKAQGSLSDQSNGEELSSDCATLGSTTMELIARCMSAVRPGHVLAEGDGRGFTIIGIRSMSDGLANLDKM
jgi:hypothetical protein